MGIAAVEGERPTVERERPHVERDASTGSIARFETKHLSQFYELN